MEPSVSRASFKRHLFLADKIVLLDGLTGTGKTMFSPLLSAMKGMQNPRFEYMFEYLSIAAYHQKISPDAASSLLNLLADIKIYDGVISRDVNFRPSDLSGVFSNGKGYQYFKQLFRKDGDSAQELIEKEKPILFLVTHQILSCLETLNNSFGERLKIIQMVRHPFYLVEHWLSYIGMHGSNSRDFTVWISHEDGQVPWFAAGWEKDYLEMIDIERVVTSIELLMCPVFEAYELNTKNVLFIPFEDFVLNPKNHLDSLESFIGTSFKSELQGLMKSQKVPRKSVNDGPVKDIYKRYAFRGKLGLINDSEEYNLKIGAFRDKYPRKAIDKLESISDRYHSNFGRWFN